MFCPLPEETVPPTKIYAFIIAFLLSLGTLVSPAAAHELVIPPVDWSGFDQSSSHVSEEHRDAWRAHLTKQDELRRWFIAGHAYDHEQERLAELARQEEARRAEEARQTEIARQAEAARQSAACGHGVKSRDHAWNCYGPILQRYGWNAQRAFNILMCESQGHPGAVGPRTKWGRAQGLMQILPGGSFDPEANIAQAWQKYSAAGGWSPWVCKG